MGMGNLHSLLTSRMVQQTDLYRKINEVQMSSVNCSHCSYTLSPTPISSYPSIRHVEHTTKQMVWTLLVFYAHSISSKWTFKASNPHTISTYALRSIYVLHITIYLSCSIAFLIHLTTNKADHILLYRSFHSTYYTLWSLRLLAFFYHSSGITRKISIENRSTYSTFFRKMYSYLIQTFVTATSQSHL